VTSPAPEPRTGFLQRFFEFYSTFFGVTAPPPGKQKLVVILLFIFVVVVVAAMVAVAKLATSF